MSHGERGAGLVSIGVPVYNGERLLPRALDSILAQTHPKLEVIVSDNASTDGTSDICQAFARRDSRIRYFRQDQNIGAAGNFNFVFGKAAGEYFKWAAHDDVIARSFVESCIAPLRRDPDVVLSLPEASLINEDSSPLFYDAAQGAFIDSHGKAWYWAAEPDQDTVSADPVKRFRSMVTRNGWCLEVFGLMRTDVLRRTGLIRNYYGSDKILLAELCTMGRFERVPETLLYRGCHPGQSSYLTPKQQAEWIRGRHKGIAFDQAWMMLGLLRASQGRDLTPRQRLACTACVIRYAFRPEKVRRLIIPGPMNYFGIGARRKTS